MFDFLLGLVAALGMQNIDDVLLERGSSEERRRKLGERLMSLT